MAFGLSSHVDLHRPAAGGAQLTEAWLTDKIFAAFSAKGIINGHMGTSAPGDTTKLWLDTSGGTSAPATWKKHNGSAWVATTNDDVAAHMVAYGSAGGTNVAVSGPLTGNGLGGSPLDINFAALSAADAQGIVAAIAADATALEAMKDAVIADLDATAVRAIVDAIQADLANAHDDLKDQIFANLQGTDAQAIVNAIQGDATALADLLTSVPSGQGVVASGNNTTGFDLGSTNGHWLIYVNDLVLSSGVFAVQISKDGGSTWFTVASTTSATNGVKLFLPLTIVCGAGAGAWNNCLNSVGVSENSGNTFTLNNGGFNGAETANNIKIKFTNFTSVGNIRYLRLN